MKATELTDKHQPHEKNVRLIEDTRSRAAAPGFDMRYAWVPAIAVMIVLYATGTFLFH